MVSGVWVRGLWSGDIQAGSKGHERVTAGPRKSKKTRVDGVQ